MGCNQNQTLYYCGLDSNGDIKQINNNIWNTLQLPSGIDLKQIQLNSKYIFYLATGSNEITYKVLPQDTQNLLTQDEWPVLSLPSGNSSITLQNFVVTEDVLWANDNGNLNTRKMGLWWYSLNNGLLAGRLWNKVNIDLMSIAQMILQDDTLILLSSSFKIIQLYNPAITRGSTRQANRTTTQANRITTQANRVTTKPAGSPTSTNISRSGRSEGNTGSPTPTITLDFSSSSTRNTGTDSTNDLDESDNTPANTTGSNTNDISASSALYDKIKANDDLPSNFLAENNLIDLNSLLGNNSIGANALANNAMFGNNLYVSPMDQQGINGNSQAQGDNKIHSFFFPVIKIE